MSSKILLSKLIEVLTCLKSFFKNVSIHGLSNLERATQPIIKVLWMIIILISACYCVLSINKSVNDYFEYKSVVMSYIRHSYPRLIPFPVITFCNLDQSLDIDDMLLGCSYGLEQCNSSMIYKMKLDTAQEYQFNNCYSINIGKDSYGNPLAIEFATYETFKLDIFLGNSDTNNHTRSGLKVFIHDQEHYPDYLTGFTLSGGEFLNFSFCLLFFYKLISI